MHAALPTPFAKPSGLTLQAREHSAAVRALCQRIRTPSLAHTPPGRHSMCSTSS